MGKPSSCEQYDLMGAKWLSQKGGNRNYRSPAMREALQDFLSMLLKM